MNKFTYDSILNCPCCGGCAKLHVYEESEDGRGDKGAYIQCEKCHLEMRLTTNECWSAEDEFEFTGGYYSDNKLFWEGMHNKLIAKWNNRPKPIHGNHGDIVKIIKCAHCGKQAQLDLMEIQLLNKSTPALKFSDYPVGWKLMTEAPVENKLFCTECAEDFAQMRAAFIGKVMNWMEGDNDDSDS